WLLITWSNPVRVSARSWTRIAIAAPGRAASAALSIFKNITNRSRVVTHGVCDTRCMPAGAPAALGGDAGALVGVGAACAAIGGISIITTALASATRSKHFLVSVRERRVRPAGG